jgi:hypothetical protein
MDLQMEIKGRLFIATVLFSILLMVSQGLAFSRWQRVMGTMAGVQIPDCTPEAPCTRDTATCFLLSIQGLYDERWYDGTPGYTPKYTISGQIGEFDPSAGRITDMFFYTLHNAAKSWYTQYNVFMDQYKTIKHAVPYGSWQSYLEFFQLRYEGTSQCFDCFRVYYWNGSTWEQDALQGTYNGVITRQTTKVVAQYARMIEEYDMFIGDLTNGYVPSNPNYGCGWQGSLGSNIYENGTFDTGTGNWVGTGGSLSNDPNGGCTANLTPVSCCTGNGAGTCTVGNGAETLKITRTLGGGSTQNAAYVDLSNELSLVSGEWYRLFYRIKMSPANSQVKVMVNGHPDVDVAERLSNNNLIHNNLNEAVLEFQADGDDLLSITLNTIVDMCTASGAPHACCSGVDLGTCREWSALWIDDIEIYQINP